MSDPQPRIRPGNRHELRLEWVRRPRQAAPSIDPWLRAGVPVAYLPHMLLAVPHLPMQHLSESVPYCVAMVLAGFGMHVEPEALADLLRTDGLQGTPGRNLQALRKERIHVEFPSDLQYFRDGTVEINSRVQGPGAQIVFRWEQPWLRYVTAALRRGLPPILFVDYGRLFPRWRGLSQPHAVVLVGGAGRQAWIQDPAATTGPQRVGLCSLLNSLMPGEPLAALLQPHAPNPTPMEPPS